MKTIVIGNQTINFWALPKGHLKYVIDWDSKPHRNQFRRFGKSSIDLEVKKDIWMSETLITQDIWKGIMAYNPSQFLGDHHPVETISYNEILSFLEKLNDLEEAAIFRLPKESEFLYACDLNYDSNFKNNINEMVWYEKNSRNQTHPVNSKPSGKIHLSDLLGNLYQFVEMDISKLNDDKCLYKGASWATQDLWVDRDYGILIGKNEKNNTIGFRIVLELNN